MSLNSLRPCSDVTPDRTRMQLEPRSLAVLDSRRSRFTRGRRASRADLLRWVLAALWWAELLAAASRPPHVPALSAGLELDGLSSGELLLGELNCTACHHAPAELLARLHPKPAPRLERVASRLHPEYVRAWLLDPQGTTPGTTMPDVLRAVPEREREPAAEELLHYLWSLDPSRPVTGAPAGNLFVQQGRVLYHQSGCVACHAPFESPTAIFGPGGGGPTDAAGVHALLTELGRTSQPLPDLATKYSPAGLAGFLREPLDVRPGGRMPSLNLTEAEAKAVAAYLQSLPPAPGATRHPTSRFMSRPEMARRGRDRFASLGCANCHPTEPALERTRSRLHARPLAGLNPQAPGGCLAKSSPQAPHYALSDSQRDALRAVLSAQTRLNAPLDAPTRLTRTLARLNCVACHARDGYGGPGFSRSDYFTGLNPLDASDEGRLPPHLDGVGAKLRPDWLVQVLTNGGAVRPYLAVRMPQFGATNVSALAADLLATDTTPAVHSSPPPGEPSAGADLVGLPGYSCITCHSFGPHPALGVSVMDLTQMTRRLNWDWFRRYLLDPSSLRPGTRMPAFWPEGQASVTTILQGDTLRQITAIWRYLSLGADAPPPTGLFGDPDGNRSPAPDHR